MDQGNLFESLPDDLSAEWSDILAQKDNVRNIRIERIVSKGHTSPDSGWYDQDQHEWVTVLKGKAQLLFEDGSVMDMGAGDHITIPAHQKHQVAWTHPDTETIWLAVFY